MPPAPFVQRTMMTDTRPEQYSERELRLLRLHAESERKNLQLRGILLEHGYGIAGIDPCAHACRRKGLTRGRRYEPTPWANAFPTAWRFPKPHSPRCRLLQRFREPP